MNQHHNPLLRPYFVGFPMMVLHSTVSLLNSKVLTRIMNSICRWWLPKEPSISGQWNDFSPSHLEATYFDRYKNCTVSVFFQKNLFRNFWLALFAVVQKHTVPGFSKQLGSRRPNQTNPTKTEVRHRCWWWNHSIRVWGWKKNCQLQLQAAQKCGGWLIFFRWRFLWKK